MNKSKVFLGGTYAETTWRDELCRALAVDYFNPIVEDWTPECQAEEQHQKADLCDIHLYVITSDMQGVFSIAEAIDSSHNNSKHTILHVIPDGFSRAQLKSLLATVNMVRDNGGSAYIDADLHRTARVINYCFSQIEGYPAP